MGEVRGTIESKTDTSPLQNLRSIREQLYDLIQIKKRDIEIEGKGMEKRNKDSVAKLQKAVDAVTEAIKSLEAY